MKSKAQHVFDALLCGLEVTIGSYTYVLGESTNGDPMLCIKVPDIRDRWKNPVSLSC